MPVRFRKLNLFQRFQNRKQTCYICGKAPADHWSYMVDNEGNFVNNPPPKYFHFECITNQASKEIAELDKEIESLVKEVDADREAKRAARIAKEDQEDSVT